MVLGFRGANTSLFIVFFPPRIPRVSKIRENTAYLRIFRVHKNAKISCVARTTATTTTTRRWRTRRTNTKMRQKQCVVRWLRASGWKTDWISIGDLETTIWKLRFGNYGWETNNLCFSNCVSPIWKLWFRNYKSPIWKPNLRDLITKNFGFDNYVLGTEIPRFGNYHSPIW